MKKILLLVMFTTSCGCSSVNVRTDGDEEARGRPSFQQRYTYWWWGLRGRHAINVREICGGKAVRQMQAVDTFTDILAGAFTLGIYAPRTARVWCGEAEQ